MSEGSPERPRIPYVPPAEQRVFGRSTGSSYRLGSIGVAAEVEGVPRVWAMINSGEALQVKAEFFTSVEEAITTDEVLGGGLEDRSFDMPDVVDDKIMAKDGKTPVSDMTADGLRCARVRAMWDAWFGPQLTRTEWDDVIAQTGNAMARGETDFDTYIMTTPYPEEEDTVARALYWQELGYVPLRRRGFVWMFHRTKDGKIVTGSLSFSGSNKRRIQAVLSKRGVHIPDDEVTDNYPGYAFTGNLDTEDAKALATAIADEAGDPAFKKPNGHTNGEITNSVDLTKQYRPIMERVFNESYVHICESLVRGYQTAEARAVIYQLADKAHHFNDHYASALYRMRANANQFTDDDWAVMHELLVYSTIEMIRALYVKQTKSSGDAAQGMDEAGVLFAQLQEASPDGFRNMLGNFGADGARDNRIYSACGLAISLGAKNGKKKGPRAGADGANESEDDEETSENGACEYTITSCYCCPYNADGTDRGKPMEVTVRREVDGVAYCQRPNCGAWLSADGKTRHIGLIAQRALRRKKRTGQLVLAGH